MPRVEQRLGYAGYQQRKASLLSGLTGDVLEIGAGTGANFQHYVGVCWTGLEPDRRVHDRLRAAAAVHGHHTPILAAPAERIPLPDASMAAVVSTVVLCSVADQDAALAEVVRVLRPGGRFVFFEHVAAAPGTWSRRLQRVAAPFTRRFDAGCDPSRETWRAIERAGFAEVAIDWFTASRGPWGPLIAGTGTV